MRRLAVEGGCHLIVGRTLTPAPNDKQRLTPPRVSGWPVNPKSLDSMTASMALRGPDAQNTWCCHQAGPHCNGYVGLGHALLGTVEDSADEKQPFSIDGKVWITAGARVNGRSELVQTLRSRGREANLDRPDVELVPRAYHSWGESCVEHLIGDFAFAIWDGRNSTLVLQP